MDTVELLKDRFDAPEAAGTESRDGENCIHFTFFMLVSRSTSTNEKDLLFTLALYWSTTSEHSILE